MNDLHDLAAPYVLDALDDLERRRFEDHLADCEQCLLEVADLAVAVEGLAGATEAAPPDDLFDRIAGALPTVEAEKRRIWSSRMIVGLSAAAVTILIVGIAFFSSAGQDRFEVIRGAADVMEIGVDVTPDFAGSDPGARVIYSRAQGAAFFEAGVLPAVTAANTYEMWIITPDSELTPAGLFTPNADGSITVLIEGEIPAGAVFAVTIERAGGVGIPTTPPVLVAQLPSA